MHTYYNLSLTLVKLIFGQIGWIDGDSCVSNEFINLSVQNQHESCIKILYYHITLYS